MLPGNSQFLEANCLMQSSTRAVALKSENGWNAKRNSVGGPENQPSLSKTHALNDSSIITKTGDALMPLWLLILMH